MPFGLKGAPSTFQAIINEVFFDLIGQGVFIYKHDVLVYTRNHEEHLQLLDKVLQRLEDNRMCPKLAKCKFGADG